MDKTLGTLADIVTSIQYDAVPQAVRHTIKRHLLDFFGCALGAFAAPPVAAIRRLALGTTGGEHGATVWGTQHRAAPDVACFANGFMGRYLDFNDQYSGRTTGHPSDVIPAALGAAEVAGSGAPKVMSGILVGYEIFGRLCDAVDIRSHWDHATLGAIASAGAAANSLGLSRQQAAHALSIATVSNNALGQTRQGELSDWKAGAFPNAARQGLFAALLAREGISGPEAPFEGGQGFWAAVAGDGEISLDSGAPEHFKINQAALKYHSGCYLGLCALDAAIALRNDLKAPEDIQAITVSTYRYGMQMTADSPAKWRPQTRETADHSLPFMIAMGLIDGFVGPEHYAPQYYTDSRILALMDKVTVQENDAYTENFPYVQTQRVEVSTVAGTNLSQQVDFPKGHPENPMSDAEVMAKFRRLTAPYLKSPQADRAIEAVFALETVHDLRDVYGLLDVTVV
jgi:2-methylcitrate dehydratase